MGAEIWIAMPELGFANWAHVDAIESCPTIKTGAGRVVTGTMTHLNGFVLRLHFDGTDETLSPTSAHRLYSETRHTWIPAGELRPGEWLKTETGAIRLASSEQISGVHRVYNIEVDVDHRYYVGRAAVLSHNSCAAGDANRPNISSSLPDRVTNELPEGETRTRDENKQARNFFKRNRGEARDWYTDRTGKDWPETSSHDEHPRALKDGGDPLFIEPGFGGPNEVHNIPDENGETDAQRWGRTGGRPPNNTLPGDEQ